MKERREMQNTANKKTPQKTARCDHTSSVSKHNKVAETNHTTHEEDLNPKISVSNTIFLN